VGDTKFSFDLGLQTLEKPTLIVCGRHDSVVGYQDAYEALGNYPMATIVIVDGAGHTLGFAEGRRLFRASAEAWLSSLEEPNR
jgi:pimeloyl-ACP methyl ester carboxylesterase